MQKELRQELRLIEVTLLYLVVWFLGDVAERAPLT